MITQESYQEAFRPSTEKRLSWTNIYQVGMCIRAMMRLIQNEAQQDFDKPKERKITMKRLKGRYSKDLKSLVKECIEHAPEDRISARDLLRRLQRMPASRFQPKAIHRNTAFRERNAALRCAITANGAGPHRLVDEYAVGLDARRVGAPQRPYGLTPTP